MTPNHWPQVPKKQIIPGNILIYQGRLYLWAVKSFFIIIIIIAYSGKHILLRTPMPYSETVSYIREMLPQKQNNQNSVKKKKKKSRIVSYISC